MTSQKVFRVLSINGGGMRGYYSATYLHKLCELAEKRFGQKDFDFSSLFQMVVGTSTGAILGVGLVAGLSPKEIMTFYQDYGKQIFPKPMYSKWGFLHGLWRSRINKQGNAALREGLQEAFGEITLGEIYRKRNIALVVPAVNATTRRGWVFKTPHNKEDTNQRDDAYSLVDVCLASSAAPIYRSLAAIKQPGASETKDMFVDGGLWANNPVLVALSEALRVTEPNQIIEIYCLGTTGGIKGSVLDSSDPHWGIFKWVKRGGMLDLSIDAQEGVFDYWADTFTKHLNRCVSITRFPQRSPSADQTKHIGLDCTSKTSFDLMTLLASGAADDTNRQINSKTKAGSKIESLLKHNFQQSKKGA